MKKKRSVRPFIQLLAAIAQNCSFTGRVSNGAFKSVCVPGLNCYSCPAAAGACPLGSLQSTIASKGHPFPFYVLGLLTGFGLLLGRAVCGFLCPFGFLQDLLYKIPLGKRKLPGRIDKPLRYLKYLNLLVLVLALPVFLTDAFGQGVPYFCELICPAGTLEGGIPLLLMNPNLRRLTGVLFWWKIGLLALLLLASIIIFRPFCRYICPLGAVYGLFNRVSIVRMKVDEGSCVSCGLCLKSCPMEVSVLKNINSAECVRCGACLRVCPEGAISLSGGKIKLRSIT